LRPFYFIISQVSDIVKTFGRKGLERSTGKKMIEEVEKKY